MLKCREGMEAVKQKKQNKVFLYVAVFVFFIAGGLFYIANVQNKDETGFVLPALGPELSFTKNSKPDSSLASQSQSRTGTEIRTEIRTEIDAEADPKPKQETGPEAKTVQNQAAPLFIHVCGEVVNPDVYELLEGARIIDAVKSAGGFTSEAEKSYCNLASPVYDGQRIYIPSKEEVSGALFSMDVQSDPTGRDNVSSKSPADLNHDTAQGSGDPNVGRVRVNINQAVLEELTSLPGIGKAKAEDILDYRREFGNFSCIEDIMLVPGIKEASFEKIKDFIVV